MRTRAQVNLLIHGIPVLFCYSRRLKSRIRLLIYHYQIMIRCPVGRRASNSFLSKSISQKDLIDLYRQNPYLPKKQKIFLYGKCYSIIFYPDEKRSRYVVNDIRHELSVYYNHESKTRTTALEWAILKIATIFLKQKFETILACSHPRTAFKSIKLVVKYLEGKWGVCRKESVGINKRIVLNAFLIHYPSQYAEYIIHHEISHLFELNHGPKFWSLVEKHVPNFITIQKELDHFYFWQWSNQVDV